MYITSSIGTPESEHHRRSGPPPYREAMELEDRRLFDEYGRACAGVDVLEVLQRTALDPIQFWEKVIRWLPKLFAMKRAGERLVREGRKSQTEFNEELRRQMSHVYPPGYALGTEKAELMKARCALAKARWRAQAARTTTRAPALHGFAFQPVHHWASNQFGDPPVCEAAQPGLERLEISLKLFKKESEKTNGDPKRLAKIGELVVSDATALADDLLNYIDRGCCADEFTTLEAQVRALPWTFRRTRGTKVVRIEEFRNITRAHANLLDAIKKARAKADVSTQCNQTSPGGPGSGSGSDDAAQSRNMKGRRNVRTRLGAW
ncbi:MAG TPA: hypothetical protein VIG25_04790 [Pyrinomonadaceae bacterium]